MKTIGNTATNIANNTKFKVDEMSLQNRRRELSVDLSNTVYTMWQKGTKFPPELTRILEELQELDERLNDMRAERYAQGKTAGTGEEEEAAEVSEEPDEESEEPETPDEEHEDEPLHEALTGASTSVRTEINECFDSGASVDKMAEKVNTSLDQLTERIRAFSPEDPEKKRQNGQELSDCPQPPSAKKKKKPEDTSEAAE